MRLQRPISIGLFVVATVWFAPRISANSDANLSNGQQAAAPDGVSHARAVSLSFVKGTVAAQRPGSREWVRTTVNTPIEEGFTIATAKNSYAEVQFENGSTLRIGEFSRVVFTQLALASHSGHVNHLKLMVGFATLNVIPERHDEYVVSASGVSVTPHGKTEFRTDLTRTRLRVEVFNGRVLAADGKQSEALGKNHVLACDYRGSGGFQVTGRIQKDGWDRWAQERDQQADLAAYSDAVIRPNGLLYGWDDMVPFGGMGNFPDASGDSF